jgi:hypothetical protein
MRIPRVLLAAAALCAAAACSEPPTAPGVPVIPIPRNDDPAKPRVPIPGPSPSIGLPQPPLP